MINKKIENYINEIVNFDNVGADVIVTTAKPKIFKELINTTNLQGATKYLVELHNTILSTFIFANLSNKIQINKLDAKTESFRKFAKTICLNHESYNKKTKYRIFFDVSFTISQKNTTGIPRVVREIVAQGTSAGIIPVFFNEGEAFQFNADQTFSAIKFQRGDCFLHADAAWNYPDDLSKVLTEVSDVGGKSILFIYDLIPLIYPKLSSETHVLAFNAWLRVSLEKSHYILCISKSVADEVMEILNSGDFYAPRLEAVGWVHLGNDFQFFQSSEISKRALDVTNCNTPYFLAVGTLEPRKAYSVALDAMEALWAEGGDAALVIVGNYGWAQSKLRERILTHPEYNKRLYWFNAASDSELHYLYQHARALVSTSLCEGFGLPVVEAANNGLPSILSDLPVFREIGGQTAQYFEVTNSQELCVLLQKTLMSAKVAPALNSKSWQEAVREIISMIKNSIYQYTIKK